MIGFALALFLQAAQADPPPPDPEIERKSFKVAEGFEVTSCTVQFFGRCRDCASRQRKPRPSPRRPRAGATTGG